MEFCSAIWAGGEVASLSGASAAAVFRRRRHASREGDAM